MFNSYNMDGTKISGMQVKDLLLVKLSHYPVWTCDAGQIQKTPKET